jgi:hypothetical protein
MGRKVYDVFNTKEEHIGYSWYCPGCKTHHEVSTDKPDEYGYIWIFSGTVECPTIRASLLVNPNNEPGRPRCHCYITEGKIEFFQDSTHELAGQIIEMKDL